ncbi:DUF7117 family protein [Halorubrum tebenquichense]|uniref:TFIIB-type zinc ribbon-containing protein n=1 Tax=Halorubrum tebenquichense DSM 14210 TaxID=1227485 RepID=M0E2P1_9EURY|nr:hypothetical protein [Halorubrum tebenquichense]ELZ42036.1 hypothetical protein C472_00025 [Halorubrum tebenquichense DSM 14210]
MKVRGERECQSCGTRWSYYETGSVACPNCGDLRSVGVDARTAHTDAAVTLDLSAHRERFGDAPETLPRSGVDDLQSDLREYCRKRGFIDGGRLTPLDGTYLAARELLEAVDCFERLRDPTDADREYLLRLLAEADDGERPPADEVPTALREARGMASVRAVEAYRSDALDFLDELEADTDGTGADDADGTGADDADDADEAEDGPTVAVEGKRPETRIGPARDAFERLRDRVARVDALGGDVPPATADALVGGANALGEYVRTGEDEALARANDYIGDATGDDLDPTET